MAKVDKAYITQFLAQRDYDVRKSRNARWIDQKCTADVLCIVADCIVNYVENDTNAKFSSANIHLKGSRSV